VLVRDKHVLVYDDDDAALTVMKTTLRLSGARVSVARSLDDVLRVVSEQHVDAVATDAMLARPRACALVIALRTSTDRNVRTIPFLQLRCAC
jgi:DNA-binding response OmpR family regulator